MITPITYHYEKVIKYITQKDDAQLPNRKLKNVYCVDISSNEIIFDLMRLRVIKILNLRELRNTKKFKVINYCGKNYCII